jgi:HK97 family phage major capsid protein
MSTTSDVMEILLDDDEADCGWVGEVDDRDDTDSPQIGLIKIPIHEMYAQPKATQKMLDDAGLDLEGWLSRKVEMRLGRKENTAFVVGDGSQKPKGFLSYDAWSSAGVYQRNAVEQIITDAASTIAGDDLIELQNSLIEDYQAGATWGMKRATWFLIATLKTSTGGDYLLNPRVIAEGAEKILLGNGVTFMNDMPVKADNALPIVYADFKEFYTVVDRFGIRILRDPYTAKPYVRFYTTKRVGGAVTNYEAGKILKVLAT